MNNTRLIGIYTYDASETLVNIVNTIEDAARWIGCSRKTLYNNLHIDNVMHASGFTVDRIDLTNDMIDYQTWLVAVNIDNDYDNYIKVQRAKITLSGMSDNDLLNALKKLKYHDEIIWSLVNLKNIKAHIMEVD